MEFIIKKTTELTNTEETDILALFNTIFDKTRTIEQFHNQFVHNPLGYSYHALMFADNHLVGSISYIPSYYMIQSTRYLSALAVDAMVYEYYRSFFNFYNMIITMHNYLSNEGVVFVYAFPNDTAYPIYIKSKLMNDIGSLTTYCLPYRIGGIKPGLKCFNFFSILFANIYIILTALFVNKNIYLFPIKKEAETYNKTRYKRLDGNYHVINYLGCVFSYKIMEYKSIRTVFLIDVFEKSVLNFNKAIRYIIKKHHAAFDLLLYVGYLPFKIHGILRVPMKFVPKNFYFIGKILKKNEIDDEIFFKIVNWDINLSNYDLL